MVKRVSRYGVLLTMLFFVLPATLFVLPGCSYFAGANSNEDDELADLEGDKETDKSHGDDDHGSTAGELELKLKVGDHFPLIKKIDQRLTQSDGQGVIPSRSLIEMTLSLRVEEIRDGKRLLSVRYHRVRYGHNIAGMKVQYNSDSSDPVPPEAMAYAGLKDNGFSFWIGPDNRVVELVGFSDFLQRCLRDVPNQYRDIVLRQLESTHTEAGLANFVDDGIGLLPYSNDPRHPAVAVKVGSAWELKPRRTEGPIPMNINTRCTLRTLTDTSAEIVLSGSIAGSSAPVVVQDGNRSMRVTVKGGYCSGACTVDRRSGLPTQSEVNRSLEMTVHLADGSEITQRKDILTTITSYLDQGGQQVSASGAGHETDSSAYGRPSNHGVDVGSSRVTQAVGTSSGFDRRESRGFGRSDSDRGSQH